MISEEDSGVEAEFRENTREGLNIIQYSHDNNNNTGRQASPIFCYQ